MLPLTIDHLNFSYPSGVTALHDVVLTIESGASVALIGQNGAGKTTLARQLNGLLQPTAGRVLIGEWDTRTKTVAQLAGRVGYVFQHPDQQIFKRTVRDEVAFGPRNLGVPAAEIDGRVHDALAAVELVDHADRHPHDLLAALRKRVALASVLAMHTPIVVLDEPTTGQDAPGVALIGAVVDQIVAQGRTVITISHDMDFVAEHCDRVVVLGQGRVLLDGSADVVFGQPDVLAQTAVEPPQITRLAQRLGLPLTWQVDRLVDALAERERL